MQVEIAIIGASSSGLLAAYLLARQGFEVAVFEQQPRFRPRERTLIVTATFREVYPFPLEAVCLHESPWMTVAAGPANRTLRFHQADLIIDRARLLHALYQKAQEAGVRIHLGHRLQRLETTSQGLVQATLQRPRAPAVTVTVTRSLLAADGVFSDARRRLGLPMPPAIPIVQARVPLPQGWDPRRTQVWFRPRQTRYFFWLIPEGPKTGALGVMTDAGVDPAAALRAFAQEVGLPLGAHQGAWVALYRPGLQAETRLGRVPVYFLGDAAGQVKNSTVGGTVTGLWAAQAVARALPQGRPLRQEARDLYRELWLHWLIRRALHHFREGHYRWLIEHLPQGMAELLGRHPRDRMAPVLAWGLLRAPRLWTLAPAALRSLLRPFPPG